MEMCSIHEHIGLPAASSAVGVPAKQYIIDDYVMTRALRGGCDECVRRSVARSTASFYYTDPSSFLLLLERQRIVTAKGEAVECKSVAKLYFVKSKFRPPLQPVSYTHLKLPTKRIV